MNSQAKSQPKISLFKKYDVPAPRYTSYPTVPYWADNPTSEQWIADLRNEFSKPGMSWSMYIHVPFCETLCTFCGCNTSITKDHRRELPYADLLLNEINLYCQNIPEIHSQPLLQLHLGGGSPTFLSPDTLKYLLNGIFQNVKKADRDFEGAIEVDPRRTTAEQLQVLREFGFNRISMGVQDFNPEVQRLVNRTQPLEMTEGITETARSLGYESVNYDLIYGLPKQTLESIEFMAKETLRLRPDRIALYSFALVPWIKPAQRLFKDEDLPSGEEKRRLYELAREILTSGGYREIGMDHFALPEDSLSRADQEGTLHRNFMGYTEKRTDVLMGIGVSAISESAGIFHQNEKVLPVYERNINEGKLATFRGHVLNAEDRRRREQILQLMTKWRVDLESDAQVRDVEIFLSSLIEDGIVEIKGHTIKITKMGRPFLRNACMALDARLREKSPQTRVFSSSV